MGYISSKGFYLDIISVYVLGIDLTMYCALRTTAEAKVWCQCLESAHDVNTVVCVFVM